MLCEAHEARGLSGSRTLFSPCSSGMALAFFGLSLRGDSFRDEAGQGMRENVKDHRGSTSVFPPRDPFRQAMNVHILYERRAHPRAFQVLSRVPPHTSPGSLLALNFSGGLWVLLLPGLASLRLSLRKFSL